jgi:hypothetical protein
MPEEQAAEFAALMQAAESAPPVPGAVVDQQEPEPPPPDLANEIAGAVSMVASILRPVLPSVAALYPPEVAGAVGGAVAEVCKKHGWLQDGFMGPWKEELACLMIVGPLAWATYDAGKRDMAAMRAKNGTAPVTVPADAAGNDPAPAAQGLSFGEVKTA